MSSNETAAARWLAIHDELLRGISHALSNRIATVGAASYMFEHGDVAVEQAVASLRAESERMDQLLQQLRLLPQRPGAAAEPITADDACNGAVKLHAHHGELRDFACDITVDPDVYPIWAEPQSFCHALLVALTTAKRNAAVPGSRIALRVTGDTNTAIFRVIPDTPLGDNPLGDNPLNDVDALNESDANAARWLLAFHGGTARAVPHGCELEVPTLLAARRARKG